MGQNGGSGEYDVVGGGTFIPLDSLIACSGCGAIFKKSKIKGPAVHESALAHITCPVCLTTQGWEPVN